MTGALCSCSEHDEAAKLVVQSDRAGQLHVQLTTGSEVRGWRKSSNDEITLGVLAAIEADGKISQRALSRELGVALGLANAYLKRCVRKGYVKIQQVPRRRYGYYLTPQGFTEKTRLTGEYLASSLTFFRRARTQMDEIMAHCATRGLGRIALVGASELAEIATLTAHDHDVTLVCVVDANVARSSFCGLPVVRSLAEADFIDAVILTQTGDSRQLVDQLTTRLGEAHVFTPRLVKLAHINETGKKSRAAAASSAVDSAKSGE